MRDLQKDLEFCDKATPGPWYLVNDNQIHDKETKFNDCGTRIGETPNLIAVEKCPNGFANSTFIVAARDGWPEAIKRAMVAEKRCQELEEALKIIRKKHTDIHNHNKYPSTVRICNKALEGLE